MFRFILMLLVIFNISSCKVNTEDKNKITVASGYKFSEYHNYTNRLINSLSKNTSINSLYENINTNGGKQNLDLLLRKRVDYALINPSILLDKPELYNKKLRIIAPSIKEDILIINFSISSHRIATNKLKTISIGSSFKKIITDIKGTDGWESTKHIVSIINKSSNIISYKQKSFESSIQSLIENSLSINAPIAIFVIPSNHPFNLDIQDGYFDGCNGSILELCVNDPSYYTFIKKLKSSYENIFQNEKKNIDVNFYTLSRDQIYKAQSIYPFYQNSDISQGILSQHALLISRKDVDRNSIKNIAKSAIKLLEIPKDSYSDMLSNVRGNILPLHTGVIDILLSNGVIHDDSKYLIFFIIYLIVFILSLMFLLFISIYIKNLISENRINHGFIFKLFKKNILFIYISLFLILHFTASYSICKIEINIASLIGYETKLSQYNIHETARWLFFLIMTSTNDNIILISPLSNTIILLQMLTILVGIPASFIITSWEKIKKYFIEHMGISTKNLTNHIALIGWNTDIIYLIDQLLQKSPSTKISILADIKFNPITEYSLPANNIGFIRAKEFETKNYSMISLKNTKAVIVLINSISSIGWDTPLIVKNYLRNKDKISIYTISTQDHVPNNMIPLGITHMNFATHDDFLLNLLVKYDTRLSNFINNSIEQSLMHTNLAHNYFNERAITPETCWSISKAMGITTYRNHQGYNPMQLIFLSDNDENLVTNTLSLIEHMRLVNIYIVGLIIDLSVHKENLSIKIYTPVTLESIKEKFKIIESDFLIEKVTLFFVIRS